MLSACCCVLCSGYDYEGGKESVNCLGRAGPKIITTDV